MQDVHTLRFTRRKLPHWLVADRSFFVTIRLTGTLPKSVVEELREERDRLRDEACSEEEMLTVLRRQFVRIEEILDSCDPERGWLTRDGVAKCVLDRLSWMSGPDRGWDVYAATVMGNHVHLLLRNTMGRTESLLSDLGQYKRQAAYVANRKLDRTGALWAREDFDHWCRDEAKVIGAVRYIAENPVKAGLCKRWQDWPWTRIERCWMERGELG